jgi:hypothetical protein
VLLCAAALMLAAGCAGGGKEVKRDVLTDTPRYSGFLSDYSKLQKATDARGNEILRWIDETVNIKHYQKFIVSDPTYFPPVKATPQVSSQVLDEIRVYGHGILQDRLAAADLLADRPGPGVVRVKVALTGVASAAQGLKAWEVVPVALVRAGVQGATGRRERDVRIFVEAEMVDSVTDRVLGLSVREGSGVPLKGEQDKLTLEHVKPKIDQWADAVVTEAIRMLK